MRTTAFILATASVALAQEVGFSDGPSVVGAPNAISSPNVNEGWQSDSSLFASGGDGGSSISNAFGSSFTNINSNSAFKDNIVNNPSSAHVQGNDGWSANGDGNALGPLQNNFGAAAPFFKRNGDVVFANNHHQANDLVQPGFGFGQVAPGFLVRRGGDVVFANNHHQSNVQAAVEPAFGVAAVEPAFGIAAVEPAFGVAAAPRFVRPQFVNPGVVNTGVVSNVYKRGINGNVVIDHSANVNGFVPGHGVGFVSTVPAAFGTYSPFEFVEPAVRPVAVRPFVQPVESNDQQATIIQNSV